jgi:streptomycin 6-kinase
MASALCLVGAVCWLVVDPTKTLVGVQGLEAANVALSTPSRRVVKTIP